MWNNNRAGSSEMKACTRDIEGEVKRLRERIAQKEKFKDALGEFIDSDSFYGIYGREDRKTLFAIFGGLSLELPGMHKECAGL